MISSAPADGPQNQPFNGSLRAVKTSATMDVERAYLVKTLVTFRGNVTRAAKAAGKENGEAFSGCSGSMELIENVPEMTWFNRGLSGTAPSAGRTCLSAPEPR